MKKWISGLLCLALGVTVLTGCSQGEVQEKGDRMQIVVTVFPAYDWTKEMLGSRAEKADVTFLLGNGVDLHSRCV